MKNRCSITSLVMRARIRATATRRPLIPEVELAWLAGFIDGEGTIYVVHERRSANRIVLKARMSIDNTDKRNIMRVLRLVSRITGYRPPTQEGNSKRGYRPCTSVRINRAVDVASILEAVLPWLVGKRQRARLMIRFIKIAPRSPLKGKAEHRARTRGNARFARGFTPRHFALAATITDLNHRYAKGEWVAAQKKRERRISEDPSPYVVVPIPISSRVRPRVSSRSANTTSEVTTGTAMNMMKTVVWPHAT